MRTREGRKEQEGGSVVGVAIFGKEFLKGLPGRLQKGAGGSDRQTCREDAGKQRVETNPHPKKQATF